MKFSKYKMIDRLTQNGLTGAITKDVMRTMDNLDGQEATQSCWKRRVFGESVLWVVGKDGHGEYVNEVDCE